MMRSCRFSVTAVAFSLLALCAAGCETPPPSAKYVLVLVDASSSVRPEDLEDYKKSFEAVMKKLGPDDKIELGLLGDATLTRYSPLVLKVLPNTDKRLDQDRGMREVSSELNAAFPTAPGTSGRTKILDGIELAQQRFATDTSPNRPGRWLVLLSDMQENGEDLNMQTHPPSEKETEAFIKSRREKNRLPSLAGVRVYVAGATSATAKSFDAIKKFWMQYFAAGGAQCDAASYQRAPLNFD